MNPQNVYRLLKQIPGGRVTNYGAIARALKQPKAGRRVGQILKQNPCPIKVPCHRVVRSDGSIGGYRGSNPANIKQKIALLKSEGIEFKNGKELRVFPLSRFLFTKFLFTFLLLITGSSLAGETVSARINRQILPLAGESIIHTVRNGDSLFLLARNYDISYAAIVRANRIVDPNRIFAGQKLVIPKETVIPKTIEQGIIINLPEYRLYLFANGKLKGIYPIAIGLTTWQTPTGEFTIINKVKDPAWYMPPEIARRENVEREIIPAGPNNPLGDRWIGTSVKHTGIHGTNQLMSIGKSLSHGCIRLYPEDIQKVFEAVGVGDPGEFLYEPVKVTVNGREIIIEVHPDIYGLIPDLEKLAGEKIEKLNLSEKIDAGKLRKAIKDSSGVPVRINLD
ncbi:MAG: methylated-DNA--[protein]-cysteine S-methyltransferase [Candidatus Ratteibacteria bacterium]|jgi:L,D-transpeptidase ErfK/SrfK